MVRRLVLESVLDVRYAFELALKYGWTVNQLRLLLLFAAAESPLLFVLDAPFVSLLLTQ